MCKVIKFRDEYRNNINVCKTQIKGINTLVETLEPVKRLVESQLNKEHHDERTHSFIKGTNILLGEIITLWYQGMSEIQNNLGDEPEIA